MSWSFLVCASRAECTADGVENTEGVTTCKKKEKE
jgi:hypothetical protein